MLRFPEPQLLSKNLWLLWIEQQLTWLNECLFDRMSILWIHGQEWYNCILKGLIFVFLKNCQIEIHIDYKSLSFHQQWMSVPLISNPLGWCFLVPQSPVYSLLTLVPMLVMFSSSFFFWCLKVWGYLPLLLLSYLRVSLYMLRYFINL